MSLTMRAAHRWLSALFTLFVAGNFVAMGLGDEQLGMLVGTATLGPLVLLMLTGAYLFVLPYLPSGRPRP